MDPEDLIRPTIIHVDGVITYANLEFCSLLGIDTPAELEGQPLDSFVIESHQESLTGAFNDIAETAVQKRSQRVMLESIDGTDRKTIAVSSPVRWGKRSQIRTSFLDLSEPSDESIHALEKKAVDEAPVGITVADMTLEDAPIIYASDGFVELTGYPRDEVLGQNCRFLQGEATREEPVSKIRTAIDAEQPITVELRNYRKDGSLFWNRLSLSPVENETGAVNYYLGYQEDISETKAHERERLLFETYAEKSKTVLFITDADGVIKYVNPAFERTTGYSASEAIGQTPAILKSGEQGDTFYEELWETITAGDAWESKIVNQAKSGERYETTQRITPIEDNRGEIRYYVALERDITQTQLREQVLDVLNRVLRHNVRNSVTIIDGHAELLASEPEEADVQAAAESIREQATTLETISERTEIVRRLIALLEGDEEPSPMDLSETQSVVDQYRAGYTDAEFELTIDTHEEAAIRHGAVFEVAVKELMKNAVEHNDQPTPRVEITITESETDEARVEIADNGPGIPRATWEIVKSGEETQLRHTDGTGLWVVYWAVTTLGGAIDLSPNEPRGSVISIQLPLATVSE
jgi:PAS domain S-box-containing protein